MNTTSPEPTTAVASDASPSERRSNKGTYNNRKVRHLTVFLCFCALY